MVAADHDDGDTQVGELAQRAVEEAHGIQAGNGTVIDVSGHEDGVDVPIAGRVVDVGEEGALRVDQVGLVEPAPQVPVRGVQEPHEHRP